MPIHTLTAVKAGRLDKTLAALLTDMSRSAIQRLIEQGRVTVNGQARDAGYPVRPGDVMVVDIPAAAPVAVLPEPIALSILYEDEDVIAVDKPAGMVVHPGAGASTGTLANAILAHAPQVAGVGDSLRPGIVHRLDKETSGIVLLAKTQGAYVALQRQFKTRAIRKVYLALCVGDVQPPRGAINKPIGRDPVRRQRMAIVAGGRESVTRYAVTYLYTITQPRAVEDYEGLVLQKGARYSSVQVHPATGRTHQIRVHLSSIGFPVVGDAVYGATRRDPLSRAIAPRHLLHASELSFELPASGRAIHLVAPMPADMRRVIDLLGE